MNYPDTIVVRFGEMMLKGRNRRRFETSIYQHIKRVLSPYGEVEITFDYGRIFIDGLGSSYEQVKGHLSKVFGLTSFSPAYSTELDVEAMQKQALAMVQSLPEMPKTFKVSTRRANKRFPHDTYETNNLIGGYILDHCPGLKVDVHNPELEVRIEVREKALIFSQVEEGPGGFPLGTNGKGMLLLSGGIDSPVAGYMALRKGLTIEAVHFHSYPYTSDRAKQKVIDLAQILSEYAGEVKLHLVPFTDIQTSLNSAHKGNFMVTFMRRAMYRIAQRLAEKNGALALVTGESLGQVASQTLPSMHAIGHVVDIPILQPLVMMDKKDIVKIAEKIGTYETSILPYDDCCTLFLPKSPTTNPNLRVLEGIENTFEFMNPMIEEAIEKTETIVLRPGEKQAVELEHAHLF
ncbi:tRNA 4-thiouridine(8) synthase ThiI [Paenibacillus sp. N1-5-1-14]|uniref:tRNA uracil 4-sulfurtransferase ThiI n=1 Tax=Paenibacillus radicibacter TaxID=2972488 RepID=UPI00215927CA|nr:tRNA uracil 4-sulfurtransferase ThiI [Paenibacillus radicibacter]MCR8641953.1 tRNA 4-thiouridine(8) synthase ThiI [Paenibacillus radicibacter]